MSNRTCTVEGCLRPVEKRELCGGHYARLRRLGDVMASVPLKKISPALKCSAGGCERTAQARGLCSPHLHRLVRYGDPLGNPEPRPGPGECSVGGCDQSAVARGWCPGHYSRWSATGDVRPDVPLARQTSYTPGSQCAVEGCGEPRQKREWCSKHYRRWMKHGDPLKVLVIHGDDWTRIESYIDRTGGPGGCHMWTGPVNGSGYGQSMLNGVLTLTHALMWERENGPRNPGVELDHECHNQAVRDGTCEPGICPHRLCCNAEHVIPRTKSEHAAATPRRARRRPAGPRRRLTGDEVREIRRLLASATARGALSEVARRYGISPAYAGRLRDRKAWAHLPDVA